MADFIPTTFRMDVRQEREAFFAQLEGGSSSERQMWICKPTGLNQGRGIFLLRSQEDVAAFRLKLQQAEDLQASRKMSHRQPQARIVQHYINNPLLLRGKKFDVRSFLLIACTSPYMVFFRHGYVRLTCDVYDPDSSNLTAHLTNQYMQKKNPLYSLLKEDTVWSMESFNTYVNDRFQVAKALPRDWVLGAFAERMQQIMMQCFCAVKSKLDHRLGLFDLIGCDFMVDEDFKVWLLEMNCNPALHTNCRVLKEVIPSTVNEALDLTLEIFNKSRVRQTLLPLASQRDFVLLYSEADPPDPAPPCCRAKTHTEPTQRSHSRCKSGLLDVSIHPSINISAHLERRLGSKASLHPAASSSSSSSSSSSPLQTVPTEPPQAQVTLRPGLCTLHHHLNAIDEVECAVAQFRERSRAMLLLASTGSGEAPVYGQREEPVEEEYTLDSDSWEEGKEEP